MMSAGSHTEPGGYTGVGRDDLHLTVRGRRCDTADAAAAGAHAEGQFDIADARSPREVAETLRRRPWLGAGLERLGRRADHTRPGTRVNHGAPTIRVQVNGESREVPAVQSLAQLIAGLGLPPQTALVEHNGQALLRSDWDGVRLADGDRLEILRVVAGG